jgi:hypothetical protein
MNMCEHAMTALEWTLVLAWISRRSRVYACGSALTFRLRRSLFRCVSRAATGTGGTYRHQRRKTRFCRTHEHQLSSDSRTCTTGEHTRGKRPAHFSICMPICMRMLSNLMPCPAPPVLSSSWLRSVVDCRADRVCVYPLLSLQALYVWLVRVHVLCWWCLVWL